MIGDPGPYVNPNGSDIYVPRTVPYLKARHVAAQAIQNDDRLVYRGKGDSDLFGFSRDCYCEEGCSARFRDDEETGETPCRVPVWKFEAVER